MNDHGVGYHPYTWNHENCPIVFKFSKYITKIRSFLVILCLLTSLSLEKGREGVFSYSFQLYSVHADVILHKRGWIPEFLLVMCHWASYLSPLSFTLLIYKMGTVKPSLLGVLWGVNKIIYVSHLDKCLAFSKIPIFIQYCFFFGMITSFAYTTSLFLRIYVCLCKSVFI